MRPLGVDEEVDPFAGEFLRLEAELIDALFVLVVADGADEDKFWSFGDVLVGVEVSGIFQEKSEGIDDEGVHFFWPELGDIQDVRRALF